ncbi:hypothetical protein Tco_0854411 [Tanacetum coccineum]
MQLVQDKSKESCMNHKEQATSSRSGNDAPCDDEISDPYIFEEPMVRYNRLLKSILFATGQQHTEQPEFNNEGDVDQNAKQCNDIRPLPAKLTDKMTTELSDQSLESENISLTNVKANKLLMSVQMASAENNTSGPVPQSLNDVCSYQFRPQLGIQDHSNEQSSSKAGPKVVPLAVKTATSRQELELLFTISYSNNLRTTGSRIKDSVRFSALTSYR